MTRPDAIRIAAAAALAAGGTAGAMLLGAPPAAALLALLAGVAAFALVPAPGTASPAPPAGDPDDRLPGLAELLQAVDEPMMVVRARRVIAANAAARDLLGDHIEGADVRLALRHPAAAERLAGPGGSDGEAVERTELVGVGDPDRPWTMTVTRLPDGSRMVRLADLSAARAAERMRADFVANASHELRTPLATLLGYLETLEDESVASDAATRGRFLAIMFEEAKRMRNLVEDLMSLSRIEAERFEAPSDAVDLVPLIESVREDLKAASKARRSEILIEREAEPTVVAGDRSQLAQLFSNLIGNALKYGREGTPVRVRIEEAGAALLRISVVDEGEGIAAEHIPRLTERFYRVDAGRSRAMGGTGLGLAIAKHIALRHGGRLEIVSKPGEGTSVQVYMPLAAEPWA